MTAWVPASRSPNQFYRPATCAKTLHEGGDILNYFAKRTGDRTHTTYHDAFYSIEGRYGPNRSPFARAVRLTLAKIGVHW
jgi:hypothetical protein